MERKVCKDCAFRIEKQCVVQDKKYVPRKSSCEEFKSKK